MKFDCPLRLLGVMSGTSTDGVDVVGLVANKKLTEMRFEGIHSVEFTPALRHQLLQLQDPNHRYEPGIDPLALLAGARHHLSVCYAEAINAFAQERGWGPTSVQAVGVHGQTIRHRPSQGYTLQIIDASLIAHQTAMPVVCDMRSADVAAGGHGAPLVPAFHGVWLNSRKVFKAGQGCAVLNLGGFSNLTVFNAKGDVVAGGDCGPANSLLDWCAANYFGLDYDADGALAKQGKLHTGFFNALMDNDYLKQAWPASTGREDFNEKWLRSVLQSFPGIDPKDLLASLVDMAAVAVARCLPNFEGPVYICGGGAFNSYLLDRIQEALGDACSLHLFDELELPSQAVEAAAFAWLAGCYKAGKPGNAPVVTGATRRVVLGLATG